MNLKTKSKKQKGGWKYDNEICEEWDQEKEVKNAFNKLSPEDRESILGVEKEEWEESLTHRRREERNKMKEHCKPKIDYCNFKHEQNGKRTRFYDPNPPDAFIDYHDPKKKLYINPEDSVETSLMFYKTKLTTDKLPNTRTCRTVRNEPEYKRFGSFLKEYGIIYTLNRTLVIHNLIKITIIIIQNSIIIIQNSIIILSYSGRVNKNTDL